MYDACLHGLVRPYMGRVWSYTGLYEAYMCIYMRLILGLYGLIWAYMGRKWAYMGRTCCFSPTFRSILDIFITINPELVIHQSRARDSSIPSS
jgi:hypothetical protein